MFVTNYNVDVTTNITGYVALDNKRVGGVMHIGGEGFVPLSFETNFVLYPNETSKQIQAYMFENDYCLFEVGDVSKYRFDLHIPHGSQFLRNETIAGYECMVWKLTSSQFILPGMVWVRYADNAIARLEADDVDDYSKVIVVLENLEVGPFDPSIYNPPDLKCVNPQVPPHADGSGFGSRFLQLFGLRGNGHTEPLPRKEPAAGSVLAKAVRRPGDPSPPKFAPQFLSNFTLVITDTVTYSTGHINGVFDFDYETGGAVLSMDGLELVPLHFDTNLVWHPNGTSPDSTITNYVFEGPLCLDCGNGLLSDLHSIPFALPDIFDYSGNKTIGDANCQWWSLSFDFFGASFDFSVYVTWAESAFAGLDISIKDDSDPSDSAEIIWRLIDIKVGPFDHSIYNKPNLDCPVPGPYAERCDTIPGLKTLRPAARERLVAVVRLLLAGLRG